MRISFIRGVGNDMDYLIPELMKFRHEVLTNDCDENCDVILSENRNQWKMTKDFHKKYPNIPLITWNWDWYDYLKKDGKFIGNQMFGRPIAFEEFTKLMRESKEVWSSTKEWAIKCEKDTGLKTALFYYCFILPWEWEGKKKDYGYILQASRLAPNKRFDWFERAANELDIPYKSYHPNTNSRPDYIRAVKNCSFSVLASREEGVGVTPMEAAYCRKPVLTADTISAKDIWGDTIHYFKRDDYNSFKMQMEWLWHNRKLTYVLDKAEKAYQRVATRYLPQHMAEKIHNRLKLI